MKLASSRAATARSKGLGLRLSFCRQEPTHGVEKTL